MSYDPRRFLEHHIANRKGWGAYVELKVALRKQDAMQIERFVRDLGARSFERRPA